MTLARLLKVYPDMFGQVYPGLLKILDPARPEQEWRALFRPGWKSPEEHVGYALAEGERLVAFLGLLFAEIPGESGPEKLCSLTSWVAHEDFRRESVSLLLPLRRETGYTITNMSGEAHVREVFRRLGFRMLEDRTTIFPPALSPRRWRRARGLRIHREEGAIRATLDGTQGQTYQDHAPYGRHLVVEGDEGYCYALYHVRRRRGLRTALFHHVSHVALSLVLSWAILYLMPVSWFVGTAAVGHFVLPAGPLLLALPALATDWIQGRSWLGATLTGDTIRAVAMGSACILVLWAGHWHWAEVFVHPAESGRELATLCWPSPSPEGDWAHRYWTLDPGRRRWGVGVVAAAACATLLARLGLWLGSRVVIHSKAS